MSVIVSGESGEVLASRLDVAGVDLLKILEASGVQCAQSPKEARVDGLISFNHSPTNLEIAKHRAVPLSRRILIAEEPPPVRPDQYLPGVYNQYGLVIASSRELADSFYHPNVTALRIADFPKPPMLESRHSWSSRINAGVLVQANKFSCVKGENYSLRRGVLAKVRARKVPLYVYGTGWNESWDQTYAKVRWAASNARKSGVFSIRSLKHVRVRVPNKMGVAPDKQRTLQHFRVAVVIENFSGYMSEKLLDSAGYALTLYVGPEVSQYGFNEQMFMPVRPGTSHVASALAGLLTLPTDEQYDLYRKQFEASQQSRLKSGSSLHVRLGRVLARQLMVV